MGLGQPLGVLPEPVLDAHVVTAPPGGMLLLYTDGVTEAMDMGRTLFGLERLQAVVRGQGGLAPERLCERVWQALTAFRGEAPQADDVTMVAVRARGQRRLTG
jgi:sigma-B regulation protein RsbU (phosphoserine phosphatase)